MASTRRCIRCGHTSAEARGFIVTGDGEVCQACHDRARVAAADCVVREGLAIGAFQERHFGHPLVTYGLCAVWTVFVVVQVVNEALWLSLVQASATAYEPIARGDLQRAFFSLWLHADIFHAVSNGLGAVAIGWVGERFIGRGRYLAVYLATGLAAGLVSAYVGKDPVGGIGASGAIFGMFGAVTAMALRAGKAAPARVFRNGLVGLVVFMVLSMILSYSVEGIAGVRLTDHLAHLAGLVSGALIGGLVLRPKIVAPRPVAPPRADQGRQTVRTPK